jgi:quinol monooxygenase YgiN
VGARNSAHRAASRIWWVDRHGRACIPAVHDEQGCKLYAIHAAEDGTITMIEKWDSREALAAHATGPVGKELGAAVAELIAQPTTVTTMTPLPARTPEQGEL